MTARTLTALLALLLVLPPLAQAQALEPTNAPRYVAPDLPAPSPYRSASGRPGPDYWQQRADYAIDVQLDPETGRVTGRETITYTNHSPDPLDYLWVTLEQNRFAEHSRGDAITPAGSRWRGSFPGGGTTLDRVAVTQNGRRYEPETLVDDTRLRIALAEPMAPGGSTVEVEIAWGFTIPDYGADRMGRLKVEGGDVWEIAQWFPQMMVYDDIRGWNTLPYLGQGEFYTDYGDFEVAITVPAPYVVVATGAQTNPEETWNAEQQHRLAEARRSAERVYIIRPDEVGQRTGTGTTTWRFRAENVRDFAWAASDRFILDAAGYTTPAGNDVLVMSAYPPEGIGTAEEPGWEEATRFGRHAIAYNSEQWYPYPYPVAINVGGIVGGMEYPMIQFSSADARGHALYGVIDHELGHNWFPMIVGSDERRHAWMDEGFNSFLNALSGPVFYDQNPDTTIAHYGTGDQVRMYRLTRADFVAGRMQEPIMQDQPIVTPADQIRRDALGFLAYRKPAAGLFLLRDVILGEERFDAAFREYIERWAYKHPQPADFFRTIENVAGEDLGWFWSGWFYSTETLDQAVTDVRREGERSVVTVANRGGLLMPVLLEVTFEDGQTERRHLPVEAFFNHDAFAVSIDDPRRVTGVRLDPDGLLPDTDPSNDVWTPSAVGGANAQ